MTRTPLTPLKFLLAILLLASPALRACSLPVFRFALEQWPAAPYEILVLHRGELKGTERQALDALEAATKIPEAFNATLDVLDLDKEPPKHLRKLIDQEKNQKLPRLVVLYPENGDDHPPAWRGELSPEAVKSLLDSPARRNIAKHLLAGNAFVWVLLESGDKKADDAAAALVTDEVNLLKKRVKFPADPNDPPVIRSSLPVKIDFPLVRVPHGDANESTFLTMFNSIDPEQRDVPGPGVALVFGRGRALPPLRGKVLTAEILNDMGTFATGECSCKVKELNPGIDLLMQTDWLQIFEDHSAPAAQGNEIPEPILPVKSAAPPKPEISDAKVDRKQDWILPGLTALAAALVLITGGAMWAARRKKLRGLQ